MKRILLLFVLGFAVLLALFPGHEILTQTYQTSARTYPENGRSVDMIRTPPEIAVRLGGMLPLAELVPWHRLSFGFPFRTGIRVDIQTRPPIMQARMEIIPFFVNFSLGLSLGFFIFCLVFIFGRMSGRLPPPQAR